MPISYTYVLAHNPSRRTMDESVKCKTLAILG